MEITDFRIQILVVLISVALIWLFFKALKAVWKLTFVVLVFLGLSFALPAMREWIFNIF